VTYPIVTKLLAAPHVKAVRAQTMLGDSYVFVVFEDGTDLYWARSRVLEYMQQIEGGLPANVHPVIGPDATGAGWVYEYVLVDRTHQRSLAELRSIQDWYLRYQLETVPGVAEVATIGGFVKQYQVNVDPNKLRAYDIPLSTVIEKVRASTNEVGGRVLEMGGAEYMIRGLGYLRSLSDLETVPVATKNGTAVKIRDLGTVAFGPDIREGVAEWQGEGETVAGIVVMRDGMNALNVINGVKKKLLETKSSLPPGVEVVSSYDRSGLIHASIETLQHDLLEEAIIVSVVIIIFLFHFRSALIPILTLPIAVLASFIRCTTSTSARTSCRSADLRSPSVFLWMRPSSWSRTVIGSSPSISPKNQFPSPRGDEFCWTRRSKSVRQSFSHCSSSSCPFCLFSCWKPRKAGCSAR